MKLFMKSKILEVAQSIREYRNFLSVQPESEIIYKDLFGRIIARAGIEDEFYPIRGAANYSLMYLVARIVTELKVERVLELGAGQSTLLLDRLKSKAEHALDITTIEHDADWVRVIQQQVAHPIHPTPLVSKTVQGRVAEGYDFSRIAFSPPYQLLIVDGPPAKRGNDRYSRMHALELIRHLDRDGFVVVIDDAERPGEALTASLFEREIKSLGIPCRRAQVNALKRQEVIGSGRFLAATYF